MIDKLNFSVGGFSEGYIFVELKKGNIFYGRRICAAFEGNELIAQPTVIDWKKFSQSLQTNGVWDWKENYDNPEILDGTQWNLSLKQGNKILNCHGSNQYPEKFESFLQSIRDLIKDHTVEF